MRGAGEAKGTATLLALPVIGYFGHAQDLNLFLKHILLLLKK